MRVNAHRVWRILALVVAALLLNACETVFVKPLPVAPNNKPDERLFGKWIIEEADKGAYVQFDAGAGSEIDMSLFGDPPEEKNPVFTLVTTRIGKYDYMSLNPTDEYRGKGYLIVRYAIEGDKLTVWLPDQEKMNAAITQRGLKGTAGQGIRDTVISDTPERVAKFLASPDGGEVFKDTMRLHRSKTDAPPERKPGL